MLLGTLGKKGHGKDTVSNYLVKNHNFIKLAYAEPIKLFCELIFSFTNEQLYGNQKESIDTFWNITPREMYQFIGTEIFRIDIQTILPHIGNNFWIELMNKRCRSIFEENPNSRIIISDVRFQNENDLVHDLKGHVDANASSQPTIIGKVIKIERLNKVINQQDEFNSVNNTQNIVFNDLNEILKESSKILFCFSDEQIDGDIYDSFWKIKPSEIIKYLYEKFNKINEYIPNITGNFWENVLKRKKISEIEIKNISADNYELHTSETSIDLITNYDYCIHNDGTLIELYENIEKFIYIITTFDVYDLNPDLEDLCF